jgi:hypothetical protein
MYPLLIKVICTLVGESIRFENILVGLIITDQYSSVCGKGINYNNMYCSLSSNFPVINCYLLHN